MSTIEENIQHTFALSNAPFNHRRPYLNNITTKRYRHVNAFGNVSLSSILHFTPRTRTIDSIQFAPCTPLTLFHFTSTHKNVFHSRRNGENRVKCLHTHSVRAERLRTTQPSPLDATTCDKTFTRLFGLLYTACALLICPFACVRVVNKLKRV